MKKFDYKWVIVGVCFLMIFVCLGFCSSNKSIYLKPITEANGFSRGAYSVNDIFRYISTAVFNLFFGHLVAKHGTKKLIICGFLSLIMSCLLYSVSTNLFGFYTGGIFLGTGFSFTTTAMVGCVVNKWFSRNKGTAMGIILSANGLGSALAFPILRPIIEKNAFGYRKAYLITVVFLSAVMVAAAIFLKEEPKSGEQSDQKNNTKKSYGEKWVGIDYKTAKKQSFFWLAAACIFIMGFMLQGITGVAAAHMEDVKLNGVFITTSLSVHAVSLTAAKFLAGFIYDKLGLRFAVVMCSISAVLAMFSLAALNNSLSGEVFAICYAVIAALALPLETIMLPIIAADLFGQKAFNRILGVFVSVITVGFAISSFAINLVYDLLGSYVPAFIICGILMIIVSVIMQFVISSAHSYRKSAENYDVCKSL